MSKIGIFFPTIVKKYWRTPLLENLSKYCPVIFCNLMSPKSFLEQSKRISMFDTVKIGEQLYEFFFPLFPLGSKFKRINKLNKKRYESYLRKICRQLDIVHPVSWFSHPSYLDTVGYPENEFLVFDYIDEYSEYPLMTELSKNKLILYEMELIEKANIIFCISNRLKEKIGKLGYSHKSYYFPNATSWVNDDNYKEENLNRFLKKEFSKIQRPIVGMTGILNERVDFVLIDKLAERRPEWSFVIIGPFAYGALTINDKVIQSVKRHHNVHMFGMRPNSELPYYIRQFNVCIIPYVKNKLNECCSPLKMYDYLASGRPIVSTDISEVKLHDHVIKLANSVDGFERKIEESLKEPKFESLNRIILSKEHTWGKRAYDMFEVLRKNVYEKFEI